VDNYITDIQTNSQTENKDFLPKLVEQLEDLIEKDINLPFHLKQIKDNGFLIKVRGLLAFLSFDYMPWKYKNKDSWNAVFKSIKGKQFYGRVYRLMKDPLFIIFNAQVEQFKEIELTGHEKYNGIIIEKEKHNLVIDFGDHFNWKCGSIIGIMHKSQFQYNQDFKDLQIGDKIQAFYYGIDKNEQRLFFIDEIKLDWFLKTPQKLIGQKINAKIIEVTKKSKYELLVDEKYNGKLTDLKGQKSYQFQEEYKSALKDYSVGDMISCKVVGVSEINQFLKLNLNIDFNNKGINDNSIFNKLDRDIISKLATITID
jgi:predicted RNA-binding protein with RPS1 domain